MAAKAREPLSIESLLQKQKEEREAASKVSLCHGSTVCLSIDIGEPTQPKFLSKEERAKLAIEKRTQELREQREKDQLQRADRDAFERQAAELRSRERDIRAPSSSFRRMHTSYHSYARHVTDIFACS